MSEKRKYTVKGNNLFDPDRSPDVREQVVIEIDLEPIWQEYLNLRLWNDKRAMTPIVELAGTCAAHIVAGGADHDTAVEAATNVVANVVTLTRSLDRLHPYAAPRARRATDAEGRSSRD